MHQRLASTRVLILSTALIAACGKDSVSERSAVGKGKDVGRDVLATVDGAKITMDDVRSRIGNELDRADVQYQQYTSGIIDATLASMVRERILEGEAKKRNVSVEDLIASEAGPSGVEPTVSEIVDWYRANAARLGGRRLNEVKPQIVDLLRRQKTAQAQTRLEARLTKSMKVAVNFQPYRLKFDNDDSPSRGRVSAPVTLVEFSDFQCPFCRQFTSTLREIVARYGDSVRVVYRQFPIASIHPFAPKAAEASLCAKDQGQFWEFHDAMFADPTKLSVEDLKVTAGALGLNPTDFAQCLDGGKQATQVARDIKAGEAVGVRGTPALFINGVELRGGAVPFEAVAQAIDQELLRSRSQ